MSGVRPQSTSVEPAVSGEKAFERIYVQKGMAVEPLVFERIAEDVDVMEEKVEGAPPPEEVAVGGYTAAEDLAVAAAGVDVVEEERVREREMSEMEKEAWRLLDRAVVNYCGSPVGTVAADDPATAGNQLNYDQVFIRDFVPSALAFLMKGEGEIVRNFLLHTLQLQVKRNTDNNLCGCYFYRDVQVFACLLSNKLVEIMFLSCDGILNSCISNASWCL